jgi:ribonuclease HI
MGRGFIFTKEEYGGLGIEEPSTIFKVESITGLHKVLNYNTDSRLRSATEQCIQDVQKQANIYKHLTTTNELFNTFNKFKSHITEALTNMHTTWITFTNIAQIKKENNKILLSSALLLKQFKDHMHTINKLINNNIHTLDRLRNQKTINQWKTFTKQHITKGHISVKKLKELFNIAHKHVVKLETISHVIPIKPKHNEIVYLKHDKQVIFYTDSGYDLDTKIATFAVVQDDNKNIKTGGRLSGQQNSYTMELNEILKALYNVRNNQSVTIYLDCLSAIQSTKKYIKSGKIEDHTHFKYKNILEAIRIEYKRIQGLKIKYIPGH